MKLPSTRIQILLLTLMYVGSFFLPAAIFQRGSDPVETWPGWNCALTGLCGVFIMQFEAFANLFFPLALILACIEMWEGAFWLAGLSSLLALETLSLFVVSFPANEGGVGPPYEMRMLHVGFFLWAGSMMTLTALAKSKKKNKAA